jgi:glycosyltransferase involved in cell wall biosynthesis
MNKADIPQSHGRPRRILIFSFAYYPRFVGGAEVAIKEITDRISADEIEFDLVTLRLDSRLPVVERIGNINIYRVGWATKHEFSTDSLPWYLHLNKYFFLVTGLLKALSLHRSRSYDSIWSLMVTYSSFTAVLFKLIHPKVRFVFTLQDGDPIPYLKRRALPLYPLFKMMFTRADHIQTISNYLADWARDMGAVCPIEVVPNGVDVGLFTRTISEGESGKFKELLGKGQGDTLLVTTSRLVTKNAVGDVIESLRYLPNTVKFLIIGQGYQEADLKKKCEQMKLGWSDLNDSGAVTDSTARVIFTGYVAHKDMPAYLKISDIFIRPSLSEGLGNSFLEAMAAGIPVIATPVGGIPDFLVEGETGLFCEVNNPKSIAQKVEKLMKDRESREYMVSNAKRMVGEKYGWEGIAEKMKGLFVC